ncbi:hypothetical protein ACWC5I_07620, partial [Kitasatospora sp. NPDC001574]
METWPMASDERVLAAVICASEAVAAVPPAANAAGISPATAVTRWLARRAPVALPHLPSVSPATPNPAGDTA